MRKLEISEIDFRVGQVGESQGKAWATLLAYKDARVDMSVLDEMFGSECWQVEYKRDTKGILQAGIGIYCEMPDETYDWVWKWSNGTESNTEAAKGEYSDAFKRAGFMWGVGRELYDMPFLFVWLKEGEFYKKDGKVKVSNRFKPNSWKWVFQDGKIVGADKDGKRIEAAK